MVILNKDKCPDFLAGGLVIKAVSLSRRACKWHVFVAECLHSLQMDWNNCRKLETSHMCRRFSSVYKAELLTLTGYYLWFPSVKSFELESSTSGIWLILRAGLGYKRCCLDDHFCLAKLLGRQSSRALFPRPVFFLSFFFHSLHFLPFYWTSVWGSHHKSKMASFRVWRENPGRRSKANKRGES